MEETHNPAPTTPRYAAPIVLSSVGSTRLVSRGAMASVAKGEGEMKEKAQIEERKRRWDVDSSKKLSLYPLASAFVKGRAIRVHLYGET